MIGGAASCATSSFLSTCKKQGMIASATSGWYHRVPRTRNLHPLLTPDSSLATTLFFPSLSKSLRTSVLGNFFLSS